MRTAHILALAAALIVAPAPVLACSVADSYRVPTNIELVEGADLIVLAKVVGERASSNPRDSALIIEPVETLKGSAPASRMEIAGVALVPAKERDRYGLLSNPYELQDAHPLSYMGGCIRYTFPLGTTALFFLDQTKGEWQPAGSAFSRWAEDVPSPAAPWVTLAKLYIRAAALPAASRRATLQEEQERLLAKADDPVAQLMAADIVRQLAGPNRTWNSQFRD